MRYLIIVLFFCYSINLYAQINSEDSLKKYSYGIYGFEILNRDSVAIIPLRAYGTGFFLNIKGNLFLITANHVFTGCEYDGIKHHLPINMNVYLPQFNKNIEINTKAIQDTSSCISPYINPDIIAVPIDNKWIPYVHSAENFIHPEFNFVDRLKIYGFPDTTNNSQQFFMPINLSLIQLSLDSTSFLNAVNAETQQASSINYQVVMKPYTMNKKNQGMSGSPVFFEDLKTKTWRLGGAFVASVQEQEIPDKPFFLIPKIDNALQKINGFINTLRQ